MLSQEGDNPITDAMKHSESLETRNKGTSTSIWSQFSKAVNNPSARIADDYFDQAASLIFVPSGIAEKGKEAIRRFYKEAANYSPTIENQESTEINVVIGDDDSLVEERILILCHNDQIPWLLPGIKPTRKRIVLPLVYFSL